MKYILFAFVCLFVLSGCDLKMPVTINGTPVSPTQQAAVIATTQQPAPVLAEPADLPAMTGDECKAAGAAKGWSATWGPASGGCWLISSDGSKTEHIGTWKE